MRTEARRVLPWSLAFLGLALACGTPSPGAQGPTRGARADFAYHTYPAELHDDCEVVVKRCSKCHTLDRVLVARVETRAHWTLYIERMRRMPGSGISRSDAASAIDCLSYRSSLASGGAGGTEE